MRRYKTSYMKRTRCMVSKITTGNLRDGSVFIPEVGCTGDDLLWHIERQFKESMTWRNRHWWDIDHILPSMIFDQDEPAEVLECNHWSNLRPIWSEENNARTVHNMDCFECGPLYAIFKGRSPRETFFDSDGELQFIQEPTP